jgi:hypothetical protein
MRFHGAASGVVNALKGFDEASVIGFSERVDDA